MKNDFRKEIKMFDKNFAKFPFSSDKYEFILSYTEKKTFRLIRVFGFCVLYVGLEK